MELKHKLTMIAPDIKLLPDKASQDVFMQLTKQLYDQFKNLYDDLSRLSPERVSALPTAASEYLGRFFILINAGAIDTLHVCIYDNSDSSYKFKTVILT